MVSEKSNNETTNEGIPENEKQKRTKGTSDIYTLMVEENLKLSPKSVPCPKFGFLFKEKGNMNRHLKNVFTGHK